MDLMLLKEYACTVLLRNNLMDGGMFLMASLGARWIE